MSPRTDRLVTAWICLFLMLACGYGSYKAFGFSIQLSASCAFLCMVFSMFACLIAGSEDQPADPVTRDYR